MHSILPTRRGHRQRQFQRQAGGWSATICAKSAGKRHDSVRWRARLHSSRRYRGEAGCSGSGRLSSQIASRSASHEVFQPQRLRSDHRGDRRRWSHHQVSLQHRRLEPVDLLYSPARAACPPLRLEPFINRIAGRIDNPTGGSESTHQETYSRLGDKISRWDENVTGEAR